MAELNEKTAVPTPQEPEAGVKTGWRLSEAKVEKHVRTLIEDQLGHAMHRAYQCEEHARHLEQIVANVPRADEDMQALSVTNADLRRQLEQIQSEHRILLQSTAWRVGRRVRAIASRHPTFAKHMRRAAKLAYWTLTMRLWSRVQVRQGAKRGIGLLRDSALFDADWYRTRYAHLLQPDTDLVAHYYWTGAAQGLDPHPLFSSSWYMSALPVEATVNPLVHYITHNGRGTPDPHPLFDTAFYSRQAGKIAERQTPLEHFLASDPQGGLKPNAVFDPVAYQEEYAAALKDGVNPLAHYASDGEQANFWPHPLFDPAWYAARNPGSVEFGALAHYLREARCAKGVPCSLHMERFADPQLALPFTLTFPEEKNPEVSIIIPVYGHYYDTWRCLASVMLMTRKTAYEVIIADDRPARPIARKLGLHGAKLIINKENLGFLANSNTAARQASGREILFLNNDTTVCKNWLAPLMSVMNSDTRVGVVGCKLLNGNGTVQEAGGIIYGTGWGDPFGKNDRPDRGCYNYVRDVDVVTGACFLVRRRLFEEMAGFDSRYAPAFYEEFDLATSIRDAGYRVVYQPASEVFHHGSASYGTEVRDRQTLKNHATFCRKWQTLLATQPAPDMASFLSRERPSSRGIILVIDDKVPEYDKHAGAVTLFQYLRLMRELGLRVIYAPQDGKPLEPYTSALQQMGVEVLCAPDRLDYWLCTYGLHVDFIWTARPDVTFPILPLLRKHTGATILYYTHDLHYLREMRRYELEGSIWALQESQRLKPLELKIFDVVDHVLTPSGEEKQDILEEVPYANVTVVPPYLFGDTDLVDAPADFGNRKDLIFVGGFDHTPNVDAALWLGQEIMPLVWKTHPDSTLWIVGNVPPDSVKALAGERIKVTGFVPELEPYFEHARVSVNPLRYGAGVKGKIVTSLQAGIPVVTTSCGNEGIQLVDGEEALIADTSTGIADAVNRLLDDESLCHTLIRSGANVVRTRFSASRARQILQNVLGDGVCSVCGSRPRQEKQARDDWRKGIYCLNCGADNRVGAVAQAMITPWRRQRVNTVHEALFYLQDLHIHELDNSEALSSELSRLRGYSHADGMGEKSLRPGSLDLLLAADDSRLAPSRAHELLKTGGRYILTVMDDPTMEAGELRQTGLHVSSHKVAMPAYDQKELWVLEARKL
ncbi:glycosyltransferase [Gluconobacter sp. LMG 31484]|uniref:Glycosyltransferase n=1 Tax=Gluconobacter vitians TaxID=2728102 RepID=A0ABR9Y3K9_9PROT|nr:glycosyltransferase [Gluconobacter vitians]MBF0858519.1 glycosyltransferase [Gluconobacter vitians]